MTFADEDEALIAAALKGSAYAWEKLVKRYETKIYNYGMRLTGNATDAMDLMQEVFLGVFRNLHRFRGDARFSSWIFRIAHNKAVDMNRRKKLLSPPPTRPRRLDGTDDSDDQFQFQQADPKTEPEQNVIAGQLNKQLQMLLQNLPLNQRLIVELKFYQAQTFEEIAEIQDISVNTAKTRYYSALKKLKAVSEENHVLP